MTEIRCDSRAGQGAVTGAKGLGDVVATTGKYGPRVCTVRLCKERGCNERLQQN